MSYLSANDLIMVLRGADRARAINAAEALGRFGGPEACAALRDSLLDHAEPTVRVACATALGLMGGRDAATALVSALNEPDRVIWHAAAEALAGLDDEAMPAVIEMLLQPETPLRRAALSGLLWLTVEYDEAEASMSDDLILGAWGWWN